MSLDIYCDGGARGNPGPAAGAFVALKDGKEIFSASKYLGEVTNNVAEYEAVILALEFFAQSLHDKENCKLNFFLDSELVARQLMGRYKINKEHLRKLYEKVKKLEINFGQVIYNNVPRSKNAAADALVNKELDLH